jgi:dihydroorotase
MKKGDFLVSMITKVSSCGTIIFQADHEYEIKEVMDDTNVTMIFMDSEWGDWVIDIFEAQQKFIHTPLRNKKVCSILNFLNDGD